jgi:transposase
MPRGELSEAQRIYCLAQVEAGVRTSKVADALKCSQRCVQRTVARWKATSSNTSRPRAGRPPILTSIDHRQLLRIARKNPRIEYKKLVQEAGMWDSNATHPQVSRHTIQRAMADQGYYKFRAKRRPKISASTARLRLQLATDWQGFNFGRNRFKFSDECSIARGSGHNTTWVRRLPAEKWSHEMVEEVTTARQPARMVWASISMTPGGRVWRSQLVVMTRDEAAARRGYTTPSYIQALKEGLRDSYRPG